MYSNLEDEIRVKGIYDLKSVCELKTGRWKSVIGMCDLNSSRNSRADGCKDINKTSSPLLLVRKVNFVKYTIVEIQSVR